MNHYFEIVVDESIGDFTTDLRLSSGHFRVSAFTGEKNKLNNFSIARHREPKSIRLLHTYGKPWSLYRMVASCPVWGAS
jgi:hypothetical protein